MKMLGKFKLMAISACVVVGMSSCLKTSEPDFGVAPSIAFVNQRSVGEYVPYIYITANEQMAQAKITNDGQSYQLENSYYGKQTLTYPTSSTLPNGDFVITAQNADGKIATNSINFDIKENQIMSDLHVDSLVYNKTDGFKAGWQAVDNVTEYCLSVTPILQDNLGLDVTVEPLIVFYSWDGGDSKATSGTFRGSGLTQGTKYRVAVTAISGTKMPNIVVQRDRREELIITWGK